MTPTDLNYIIGIDGVSYLKTKGMKDVDITCQGISARNIISNVKYNGISYGSAEIDAKPSGNYWTFSFNYGSERYLKDGATYGYDYAIACGGPTDHLWTLEPVDSIPVNFDVQIINEVDEDTTYYTTLYTAFPYQCVSGIKAKYAKKKDNSSWEQKSVPDNLVHSKTGVILVSSSRIGYIKPLFNEPDSLTDNLLKGAINLIGDTTAYDSLTMRVLGLNSSSDSISFVKSNKKFIPSNTAYLDISSLPSYPQKLIRNNEVSGISNLHTNIKPDNSVYDLSGRKVTGGKLPKGIYIKEGKKYIVR